MLLVDELEFDLKDNSPEPRYYQLYSQVKNHILNRILRPGDRLPSERKFAEVLGLHRNTVRKAIQDLIREGICIRRLGVGVFVADDRIRLDMQTSMGLSRRVKDAGHDIQTIVIDKEIITELPAIHEALEVPLKSQLLRLKRLRLVDGEPAMLEISYLSLLRFPGIAEYDFSGSLYSIIRHDYDIRPTHAKGVLRYNLANHELGRLLNIPINSAVFDKRATVYSDKGLPIEYIHGLYRGDRVEFAYYVGQPEDATQPTK